MSQQNAIINELEEALSDGSADRRIKTLRRVTDLFVFGSTHFSADHVTLFDGVFNHLVADLDLSARTALSERLAPVVNAPPNLIRKLAFDDEIAVAGPVLEKSPRLENVALIENAGSKSQKHLLAISKRKEIAETVTDVLVERGDREVVLNVANNQGAKVSETGYLRLIKRSEGDDELTRSVGSRPEIRRQHFLKLLSTASNAVRASLEAAHPEIADEIRTAVGAAAAKIQETASTKSRSYASARKYVEGLQAKRVLVDGDVAAFASSGKFEETAVTLSLMAALPIGVIERIMVQDLEETIMIVAKAIGLSWSTVKSVLRLCAGKAGVSEQALGHSLAIYSRLKRETAQQVVEFQRQKCRAEAVRPA